MRRAAKRDDNEALIVTAFQSAGWTVVRVSDAGAPDLICVRMGEISLVEVKGPKGTLTPAQEVAFERLNKAGVTVLVVRSPQEALNVVGAPRMKTVGTDGERSCWVAQNGGFLCESCWLPENGLHARDCPNRTALKPKPKVQSAHRAAKKMAGAMPKRRECAVCPEPVNDAGYACAVHDPAALSPARLSRGVEGELQPLELCKCGCPHGTHSGTYGSGECTRCGWRHCERYREGWK